MYEAESISTIPSAYMHVGSRMVSPTMTQNSAQYQFCLGAKRNLSGLLALGTEDGRIHLVDREGGIPHAGKPHQTL